MTADGLPSAEALRGRAVLQVLPELSAGGVERTVLEVAEALSAAGAEALVASEGGRLVSELQRLGGRHVALPLATKNPAAIRRNAARLAALCRDRGVALIHARSRAPAWSALWAARRTALPFVTTYHGAYGGRSAPKRLYNSVMARGDIVIANSDWIAAHVRERYRVPEARLRTIPRGVDLSVFAPERADRAAAEAMRQGWLAEAGAGEDAPLLLLPGRLTAWKGQRTAIEALAALEGLGQPDAVLVLLGDAQGRDDYVAGLDALARALGVRGRTVFAPHTAAMAEALLAATLVLAPSTRPEAFGRTAAEASAMERPVIASDQGGARETVLHRVSGLRVPPGDGAALARAAAELLEAGPERRLAMGRSGRAHIEARYTKTRLQRDVLAVYGLLLEGRAPSR